MLIKFLKKLVQKTNKTDSNCRKPVTPFSFQIVIFSKDRAAQLNSLLLSIHDHCKYPISKISILYKSTSPCFDNGYKKVMNHWDSLPLQWLKEVNFHDDLITLLSTFNNNDFVMFLVDDDILFAPFYPEALFQQFTKKHLFISTRASRTYSQDKQPRKFLNDKSFLEWKWDYQRKPATWNYPFSVDGNIFKAGVIRKYIAKLPFVAPNSLEGILHNRRHHAFVKKLRKALAPLNVALYNNPLNRVQTEGSTFHGEVTAEYLNEQFLSGKQIDNSKLYSTAPQGIHHLVEVNFTKE